MEDARGPQPRVAVPGGRLLDALPVAALIVDCTGVVARVNGEARRLLGASGTSLKRLPAVESVFAETDQEVAGRQLSAVLQGESWSGELRVQGREGEATMVRVSLTPLPDTDGLISALVLLEASRNSTQREDRLAERLTRLGKVGNLLLSASTQEAVTEIVVGQLADAAGASAASLCLRIDDERLQLLGVRGAEQGAFERWRTFDAARTPAGDCVVSARPLVLTGSEEIEACYPGLEAATPGERTLVCLPLVVRARAIGVVSLSFSGERAVVGAELEYFRVMSDACAQAIDRVRAQASAADRAAKLQFLADSTAELASSLDYESTLANVARLAVPWFADWCSIAVSFDGDLHTLAVAHVDPEKVALAREFEERWPPDRDAPHGAYHVLRTGKSELTPELSDDMLEELVPDHEQRAMLYRLNIRGGMSVPLKVGNRVLGVVTWVVGDEGRRFDVDDLAFGEDLARRAAVAIENAKLHTDVSEMAMRLQRAALPDALPERAGWEMSAHYSPAGQLEVGGDFYDVLPLDDDRFALFIGDVMGRGVDAAAAMAQVRSATRSLMAVDPAPIAVMTRMDQVFDRYELSQLVTMLYAVVDESRDEVTIANAGHLSPLVIRANGGVEVLPLPEGLLLGAGGSKRTAATFQIAPGETLLVFTDGLIERRGEDIEAGQARLLAACAALRDGPLAETLGEVVREVTDPVRDDDVAALVLRRAAVLHPTRDAADAREPARAL